MALFVDLTNLYSGLLRLELGSPELIRDFFLAWFDFDMLARELTNYPDDVWIFYSGGRLGPSKGRVDSNHLKPFIDRINSLKGVTARDVNIPGDQREIFRVRCTSCDKDIEAESISEKGIDASLTVHLFDTMDAWEKAYIISGDADYVPAVASLRRRGKIVIGVGFPNASTALVRECYDYIDITDFIRRQLALYELFHKDGFIRRLFCSVEPDSPHTLDEIGFRAGFSFSKPAQACCAAWFAGKTVRFAEFNRELQQIQKMSNLALINRSQDPMIHCQIDLLEKDWEVLSRRFDELRENIGELSDLGYREDIRWAVKYVYDDSKKKYVFIPTEKWSQS